jgi:hypothetical protein
MPTTAVAVLQAARARYAADEAARRQAEAARRQAEEAARPRQAEETARPRQAGEIPELPDVIRDEIMDLRWDAMWAETARTRPVFLSPAAQSD